MRVTLILACLPHLFSALVLAATTDELKWNSEAGYKWTDLPVAANGRTGFTALPPTETGVLFTNTLDTWSGEANRVLFNGSGVALGDYDNDGLPDIYFGSLNGKNTFYKNLGHWKFQDVTAQSGIRCTNQFCRGAVFADINGDSKLDLLVATTGEGVLTFLNIGNGAFTNRTSSAGTRTPYGAVTMALADVDGNGTLDLYVANNRTDDIRDRGQVNLQMQNGKLIIPPQYTNRLTVINGKLFEFGEPDQLYLNDGNGRFSTVSWTNGAFLDEDGRRLLWAPLDWGLAAAFRDLNDDGWPDLYVCNDYWTPDRLWINDRHGNFRAARRLALRNTSASSMGVDFADITRSGKMDFFVVDMLSRDPRLRNRQMLAQTPVELPIGAIENRPQIMRNTLALNRGDGTFAEVAEYAGLTASEWSWSPVFVDVDLDGFEDLLISTGHVKDVQDLDASAQIDARERQAAGTKRTRDQFIQAKIQNARLYPHLEAPVVAFRNLGNLKFEEVTTDWGTHLPGVHHAIAMADLDGDGDLDFVLNNLGSPAGMYRNDSTAPRVAVKLKGLPPNTQGIGALVKLLNGAVPLQMQEVASGGHYMAGSDPCLVFAAGASTNIMGLRVQWRSGRMSSITGIKANRFYEIEEQGSILSREQIPTNAKPEKTPPLFQDVSQLLSHEHHEDPFDDFQRQPSLPRKLSQSGPGVAWFDLDGDGWEDLVIGTGKGATPATFRNNHKAGFEKVTKFSQPVTRDQTGIVAWNPAPGQAAILIGSPNYEDGLALGAGVRQYSWNSGDVTDLLPANSSSTGSLAMADIDGDGDLDLFVGGRVIAARYPEAATSRLYLNENNTFKANQELAQVGLVSGAIWSDLDQDGLPELILACEWGPIRVFHNERAKFKEITSELGLQRYIGWWTGVNVGDFDGDGKLDIVAGNWGLNTPYHASPERPVRLYYGDFSGRNAIDLVEADWDAATGVEIPRRNRNTVLRALPDLAERFPTHHAFSEANMQQILGSRYATARHAEANFLATAVFFNRGNHFEMSELPREAQFAPVFGVSVADFNGDGHEDAFLSQNFFANRPEVPRADAGRGSLLLGDGKGRFTTLSAAESGISIYGEQRGAALADYDHDARTDLLVTQNGAGSKLFRNSSAKPGLRVTLLSGDANPHGIGAILRLKFREEFGAARQVSAGSGYLSQDSAVQVLGTPGPATACLVAWPGGRKTETIVPRNATEIAITTSGQLQP